MGCGCSLLGGGRIISDDPWEAFDSSETADVNEYNDMKTEDFSYGDVIQKGSFGVIVEVTKKSTQKKFAMKIQSKQIVAASLGNNAWRVCMEPRTFASVSHPFISELSLAFQTETLLILVMSLGTGSDLNAIMKTADSLSFDHVCYYAAEIASALCYLHSIKLVYRNLKPINVLVNADGYIQLSDFSAVTDMDGETIGKFALLSLWLCFVLCVQFILIIGCHACSDNVAKCCSDVAIEHPVERDENLVVKYGSRDSNPCSPRYDTLLMSTKSRSVGSSFAWPTGAVFSRPNSFGGSTLSSSNRMSVFPSFAVPEARPAHSLNSLSGPAPTTGQLSVLQTFAAPTSHSARNVTSTVDKEVKALIATYGYMVRRLLLLPHYDIW